MLHSARRRKPAGAAVLDAASLRATDRPRKDASIKPTRIQDLVIGALPGLLARVATSTAQAADKPPK